MTSDGSGNTYRALNATIKTLPTYRTISVPATMVMIMPRIPCYRSVMSRRKCRLMFMTHFIYFSPESGFIPNLSKILAELLNSFAV
jgi:hypothetical protein